MLRIPGVTKYEKLNPANYGIHSLLELAYIASANPT